MKNFKNRAFLIIIGAILLISMFNCFQSDFFQNNQNGTNISDKKYGGLKINIIDSNTRTILPDFIAINHYDTTGDGPDGNKLSVDNIIGTSKVINSILVGSWKLTVLGKDASNNTIAKGEATADIIEDQTTVVNIIVNYCQFGTGIVDLTIDWPGTISVDSVILKINDATSEIYTMGDSVNYTNSSMPSGSHKFFFSIKKSGQTIAAVTESVHVYDYLTTSKTISLLSSDFKSAPVAPSALTTSEGTGKIVLNWTDNSNVETGFVVERSETSGAGFTALGGTDVTPLSANTATYDDATAVIGTTYYYKVKAVNIYGNSDYCLEASRKYDLPLISFGRNGNTTAQKEQTTDVEVTDQSDIESGYPKYQWAQSATFPTEGTWTQFTSGDIISQSTGDGDYYLHIHALDSKGNESRVTSNKFVLDSPPTVGNSGNLTFSDITSSSITVNWTDATDAVTSQENLEYLVYYSITADIDTVINCENNGTVVGSYTANIYSKAVSDLSSDTIYYFNVVVRDGAGNKSCYNMNSKGFYTITYNLNGGTVSNPTIYTVEAENITLNNPTRTGYAFVGWSGTELTGINNTTVTIVKGSTGNREYTANWSAITYNLDNARFFL